MSGIPQEDAGSPPPLIIPEEHHPLRPEMLDEDAVFVMRKLNKSGFSSYLVGGGVRDLYLGKAPKDFDISTDARPGQIRKLFPNSATIGKRFRLVQVFFRGGKIIEVSTLRSHSEFDIEGPEAVLAPNNTFGSLPDDAQRRDLSINSLFYELENNTIIDYIDGVTDLDRGIIRITGEAPKRITRDPVRMLRAIRHAARNDFMIEEATWKAICSHQETLLLCPPSRIRDEIFKDLYSGSATPWLELMITSELFQILFPSYRDILHQAPPSLPSCRDQLTTVCKILDLFALPPGGQQKKLLPKSFVFALLLLPWAELRFSLSKLSLKGPEFFQLSKKIRRDIDNQLGCQFNLRKSIRQEMVTLLCNIPRFVRYMQNGTAPKWLKKKSYYDTCRLFYTMQQAVISGKIESLPLNEQTVPTLPAEEFQRGKAKSSKPKSRPAFASKKKGGIFGL